MLSPPPLKARARQVFLVLGMHRSGTSAVAGAVRVLGSEPPLRLLPPAPDNPNGFFESPVVLAVNEWMLKAGHATWFDCLGFDANSLEPSQRAQAMALANICFLAEFPTAACPLLKDPRLCLLLDYWLPVLQSLAPPIPLLVLRHPAAVVASLARRDACPVPVATALWLHHMLTAEHATRGLPRAIVSFDALLLDWRRCLSHAAAQAGIAWPASLPAVQGAMEQFLDGSLRHHGGHAGDNLSFTELGPLAPWLQQGWATLCLLAEQGAQSEPLRQLDQLRAEFAPWRREQGQVLTDRLLAGHPLRRQPRTELPPVWVSAAAALVSEAASRCSLV